MYVYCTLKIYLLLKYGHGRGIFYISSTVLYGYVYKLIKISGQYNPTTTVHTSTTGGTAIRFGPSYIKTLPGILKIIQIVSYFSYKEKLDKKFTFFIIYYILLLW